jgi:putative peptidoglycan lipid II flippase
VNTVTKPPVVKTQTLGRASTVMAAGTLASRLTGFLRTVAVGAAVGAAGTALGNGYQVANTLPNIAYDLLLGGLLTSVFVPMLARSRKDDSDDGVRFAQVLLTLVTIGLLLVTLVLELLAPWLTAAYGVHDPIAVEFTRWFLPQLVFYGMGAMAGAILNTRNRFALPMVLPVLNNVVVIACAAAYLAMPGSKTSHARLLVLEAGTTLGVVAMTIPLIPALRAAGVPWRWRFEIRDPRLRLAARLGGWTLGYVVVSQLGFLVVANLANGIKPQGEYSAYSFAYTLFQLPYAVIAVSVITALLPAMSRHAHARRLDLVRGDLSRSLRLSGGLVVPAAVLMAVLSGPIAIVVFWHGNTDYAGAKLIGEILGVLAIGLIPFTIQQVLLRGFFALQDSKTPFVMGLVVTTALVVVDLVVAAANHGPHRVVGLAGGFVVSYTVGAAVTAKVVLDRLGGHGRRVARLFVRVAIAGAVAAGITVAVATAVASAVPGRGFADALAQLLVAGPIGGGAYLITARLMRIREVEPVRTLLSRLTQVRPAA